MLKFMYLVYEIHAYAELTIYDYVVYDTGKVYNRIIIYYE